MCAKQGVAAIEKPLRFYGSDQIHSCHRKAMEALGLGNRALRRIPTDADCASISERCGPPSPRTAPLDFEPACIIGTAGTVNTGAIDDLQALADAGGAGGPLVSCRRLHRRTDRHRAPECVPRRRH